jgi:hypothetical protein
MSIADAQRTADQYYAALVREIPNNGIARFESWLPCRPARVFQALKIVAAFEVHERALTPELRSLLGGAASALASFAPDSKAKAINDFRNKSSDEKLRLRAGQESRDLDEFRATSDGLGLRLEFEEYLSSVEGLDLSDPIFFQRVYTLIGLEYTPPRKLKFWP